MIVEILKIEIVLQQCPAWPTLSPPCVYLSLCIYCTYLCVPPEFVQIPGFLGLCVKYLEENPDVSPRKSQKVRSCDCERKETRKSGVKYTCATFKRVWFHLAVRRIVNNKKSNRTQLREQMSADLCLNGSFEEDKERWWNKIRVKSWTLKKEWIINFKKYKVNNDRNKKKIEMKKYEFKKKKRNKKK